MSDEAREQAFGRPHATQRSSSVRAGGEVGVSAATCGVSSTAQPVPARTGESSAAAPSSVPLTREAEAQMQGASMRRTVAKAWRSRQDNFERTNMTKILHALAALAKEER